MATTSANDSSQSHSPYTPRFRSSSPNAVLSEGPDSDEVRRALGMQDSQLPTQMPSNRPTHLHPTDFVPQPARSVESSNRHSDSDQPASPSPVSATFEPLAETRDYNTPNFDEEFINYSPILSEHGDDDPKIVPKQEETSPRGEPDQTNQPRSGIDPADRATINELDIPTIDELKRQRELDEDRSKVETWLTRSRLQDSTELEDSSEQATDQDPEPQDDQKSPDPNTARIDKSNIPGPGKFVKVDETPEDDDDDDDDDDEDCASDTTPPARAEEVDKTDTARDAQPPRDAGFHRPKVRPWTDSPIDQENSDLNGQPISSNAAMAQFMQRARDIETASFTATLGSRRRSEADVDSLYSVAAASVKPPPTQERRESKGERRPNIFSFSRMKRSNSNIKKRKEDESNPPPPVVESIPQHHSRKDHSLPTMKLPGRGSWSRPKSPKADTDVPTNGRPLTQSPTNTTHLSGPWESAKGVLRRARSRSDLPKSADVVSIAERWARQGGPPVPSLKPPTTAVESGPTQQSPHVQVINQYTNRYKVEEEEDAESPSNPVSMPLYVRETPSAPNDDGFRSHVCRLNPRLEPFMVDRVTKEQIVRHRRLVEVRMKHEAMVRRRKCPSSNFCFQLGHGPRYISPVNDSHASQNASEVTASPCYIVVADGTEPPKTDPEDGSVMIATFPDGIPIPPVNQLPAEFECPLCFQVKKIHKPSDWTKHVHEDVQPFTCSFPNCGDPKSFKRKADWVRHENERHRQLEKWICSYEGCHHVCFRKDNFVQHLVREHKFSEPRVRASRVAGANEESEKVASMVENCRQETERSPTDEPCRFCGNLCTTWKKLTVHLAKHMEQISMPVLNMIDQVQTSEFSEWRQASGGSRATTMQSQSSAGTSEPSSVTSKPSVLVGSTYPPPIQGNIRAQPPRSNALPSHMHSASASFSRPSYNATQYSNSYSNPTTGLYGSQSSTSEASAAQAITNRNFQPMYPTEGLNSLQISGGPSSYPPTWASARQDYLNVQPQTVVSDDFWESHGISASPTEGAGDLTYSPEGMSDNVHTVSSGQGVQMAYAPSQQYQTGDQPDAGAQILTTPSQWAFVPTSQQQSSSGSSSYFTQPHYESYQSQYQQGQ